MRELISKNTLFVLLEKSGIEVDMWDVADNGEFMGVIGTVDADSRDEIKEAAAIGHAMFEV